MDTSYCRRCQRDNLPAGFLCTRNRDVKDNGADRDPELTDRYEGTCLHCCDHNHG